MLWPLVLLILAVTIDAGDVITANTTLDVVKARRNSAGVKPVRSANTLENIKSAGISKKIIDSKQVRTVKNTAEPFETSKSSAKTLLTSPTLTANPQDDVVLKNHDVVNFNLINGTNADVVEFPFYAMLSKRVKLEKTMATGAPLKSFCGSSLIHPRFLISAWHCFKKNNDPKHVVAIFHVLNRCKPDKNNIAWHELRKFYFYPGSTTSNKAKRHDVALIELLDQVTDVSPLLMPSQPPVVGVVGTIVGFGRTAWSKVKNDAQLPCVLQKTYEVVEAWENCRHPAQKVVGAFCGVAITTTACRGDSGGPWLTWNNGAYELQGVVSFGSAKCDARQASDHYTNVYAYKDWVFDTIRRVLYELSRT